MKQLIFIHGGEAFSNYDDFLEHLRTRELRNVLTDAPQRWKSTLRTELGDEYEVYLPQMPNKENAKYEEWKIWFERCLELVGDDVVLIGHSQGGVFLAKYLSENTLPIRIQALFLIAAPYETADFGGEDGGDFFPDTAELKNIPDQVADIHIIHSTDDVVVPYEHAKQYAAALPNATLTTFENRGHFLQEEFPELIEMLR